MNAPREFDQIEPELVAALVERAQRKPLDSRLPPSLWIKLAHLRQNFDGQVHAVALLEGHTRAVVLLIPAEKADTPPNEDWRRIDEPHFLLLAADHGRSLAH